MQRGGTRRWCVRRPEQVQPAERTVADFGDALRCDRRGRHAARRLSEQLGVAARTTHPVSIAASCVISTTSDLRDAAAAMRLLGRLDELGPSRVSDRAKADRCAQPTMTTLVRRQEEQGWVRRDPDPSDSRASLISLTAAGRRELGRARREAGDAIADRLSRPSDDDVRRLRDAVPAMRAVHAVPADETLR
ncbi:MAG: MarR family winged helix-turn-helix transcriptional regulator [Kribbellaceae bacterium]